MVPAASSSFRLHSILHHVQPTAARADAVSCGILPQRSGCPQECARLALRDGAAILTGCESGEHAAAELPWRVFGDRCHSTLRPTEIRMVRTGAGVVAVTRLEEPGPLQGSGRGTDLEAEGDFQEQDLHRDLDPLHQDGIKAFGAACPDFIFLACDEPCREGGGENFLVDGAAVLDSLTADARTAWVRSTPHLRRFPVAHRSFAKSCSWINMRKNWTKPVVLQVPNALESTAVRQVFHAVTVGGVGVHDMPLVARDDLSGRLAVRVPNVQDDPHARILPIPPADDDDHSAAAAATVRVEAHDPDWARRFGCIQERALTALQGITTRIEHVGSTSVPGLAAKPIIDVDAVIADKSLLPAAVAALRPLGYAHRGELGIDGRHAFRYSGPTDGAGTPFWRHFISNAKRSSFNLPRQARTIGQRFSTTL